MKTNTNLVMWAVYEHPTDYPDEFVARKWILEPRAPEQPGAFARATEELLHGQTLEEIRLQLPDGLHRLPRQVNDEAQIVETWL